MNNSVSTMTGKTKIKIVLLGNQSVGKSCIIEKYVKDRFDQTANCQPTVGIDFLVKNVTYHNKSYRLQLWDTAGQERFRSLIPNYLKDAKCALIVVDVTNRASLNSAESWLKLYNDNRTCEGFSFLIGNKIDLEYREIEQEEAKKKAEELGLPYYEVSAKTGQNLEQLFQKLIQVTEQKSVAGVTFELTKKQSEAIKEQENNKEEDTEIREAKAGKSESKKSEAKAESKKQVVTVESENKVVLKNQKIEKKKEKGQCC